ncbi:Clavaminate synthase-like protein [Dacryopinax primogenitus]|uniref:Clavaminate synthase-like protein n=1 Tax=Dacryopinax primogenitus (strain DJM 731) TaxID=1858805 RepID=M5GBM3_DACPD|nr:Clavaminate synthase-like protein [Dacryopinax primogenitus]EJU06374.1 Clavaminate synthase-like protein [Dacryopinax primogenitus]
MFVASRNFFEQESIEEKTRCRRVHPVNSGWVGQGVEKLDAKESEDLKEAFNIMAYTEKPKQTMPKMLEGEVPLIADFISACHDLCMDLLEGMALSLDLEKDYFTLRHAPSAPSGTTLRLLYYPSTTTTSQALVRAGAHSDYGSLTLLFQQEGSDASGLQVLLPTNKARGEGSEAGEWLDVPASPERVLVNVGDLMEAWTGSRWPSTIHRVLVPANTFVGPRLSIAYFLQPADDVKLHRIGTLAAGQEERGGGRVFEEGMTSGEWLARRFEATYRK